MAIEKARRSDRRERRSGIGPLRDTRQTMSENLDLVRSIYADWERGDYSRVDWADPEIELEFVGGPDPGRSTGLPAIAQAWRTWLESWSVYRAEAETVREVDDTRVLVLIREVGRGKASGIDVENQNANVLEISDGKVTRIALYPSCDRALADLGLED
jgi:ketosteroid isomerase-like protein